MANSCEVAAPEVPEPKGLPPPSCLHSEDHPLFQAYSMVHAAMLGGLLDSQLGGDEYIQEVERVYLFLKKQKEEAENEFEEVVPEEDDWDLEIPLHKNKRFVKAKASPPKRTWKNCKATIGKK